MSSLKAAFNVRPLHNGSNRNSDHNRWEPVNHTWSFAAESGAARRVDFVLIRNDFQ